MTLFGGAVRREGRHISYSLRRGYSERIVP